MLDDAEIQNELRRKYAILTPKKKLDVKSDELKKLRESRGISQEAVASTIEKTQGTYSKLENGGIRQFQASAAYKISLHIGCELWDIAHAPEDIDLNTTDLQFDLVAVQLREVITMHHSIIAPLEGSAVDEAYSPVRLFRAGNKDIEIVVDSARDFGAMPVLIQGDVGQGKTVLLRRLALRALDEKESIPVFLELHGMSNETIKKAVYRFFSNLDLGYDEDQVSMLLKNGGISIYLDGFDEVPGDLRSKVVSDIDDLHSEYPDLSLIVTSRYRSGIERIPYFNRFGVARLQADEISSVLSKYLADNDLGIITAGLQENQMAGHQLASLLSSPLMVVALVLHYSHAKSLPESKLDLYRKLPKFLFDEQNKSARGLKRKPKSGLDIDELRHFFDSLCFVVLKNQLGRTIRERVLFEAADEALRHANLRASGSTAISDVVEITNLLSIQTNYDYEFLHSAVLEACAAEFIRSLDEDKAQAFYRAMQLHWREWKSVMVFLKRIDHSRFTEWFRTPLLREINLVAGADFLEQHPVLKISRPKALPYAENEYSDISSNSDARLIQITFVQNHTGRGHPAEVSHYIELGILDLLLTDSGIVQKVKQSLSGDELVTLDSGQVFDAPIDLSSKFIFCVFVSPDSDALQEVNESSSNHELIQLEPRRMISSIDGPYLNFQYWHIKREDIERYCDQYREQLLQDLHEIIGED